MGKSLLRRANAVVAEVRLHPWHGKQVMTMSAPLVTSASVPAGTGSVFIQQLGLNTNKTRGRSLMRCGMDAMLLLLFSPIAVFSGSARTCGSARRERHIGRGARARRVVAGCWSVRRLCRRPPQAPTGPGAMLQPSPRQRRSAGLPAGTRSWRCSAGRSAADGTPRSFRATTGASPTISASCTRSTRAHRRLAGSAAQRALAAFTTRRCLVLTAITSPACAGSWVSGCRPSCGSSWRRSP